MIPPAGANGLFEPAHSLPTRGLPVHLVSTNNVEGVALLTSYVAESPSGDRSDSRALSGSIMGVILFCIDVVFLDWNRPGRLPSPMIAILGNAVLSVDD